MLHVYIDESGGWMKQDTNAQALVRIVCEWERCRRRASFYAETWQSQRNITSDNLPPMLQSTRVSQTQRVVCVKRDWPATRSADPQLPRFLIYRLVVGRPVSFHRFTFSSASSRPDICSAMQQQQQQQCSRRTATDTVKANQTARRPYSFCPNLMTSFSLLYGPGRNLNESFRHEVFIL